MNHESPAILLVDDDRDLLQLISMRLSAAGSGYTHWAGATTYSVRQPW